MRRQDFELKHYFFKTLNKDGNHEFSMGRYDRACRRYEEALCAFRYFEATDPQWQSKGIDDDHLREVDIQGDTPEQVEIIRKLKVNTYLNIAACNLKTRGYETAVRACDEALKLERKNSRAYFRRARAYALPINAGVPEFKKALKDLSRIDLTKFPGKPVEKEKARLEELVKVNTKREQETYSKMFKPGNSVSEFVRKNAKTLPKILTSEEKAVQQEMKSVR